MNRKLVFRVLLPFFLLLGCVHGNAASKKRVLIGSPIRQSPQVLTEFLNSLDRLEQMQCEFDYFFVDDNVEEASRALLKVFAQKKGKKCLLQEPGADGCDASYVCTERTHHWNSTLVWKVAAFKDRMITHSLKEGYDFLFLVDSDLVLHPHTIEQLLRAEKEIVSNIFWTQFLPNHSEQPQVWVCDQSTYFEKEEGAKVSAEEERRRSLSFFTKLEQPGIFEVGGLGACTLISRSALKKGCRFERIKNLSFEGEDRHFCVRAVAMGLSLFVDTHLPAYHIYREKDLAGVESYLKECGVVCAPKSEKRSRITLSMVVRNEEKRYLRQVLEAAREYVTDAVIIDDASTDNTVDVCREVLQGIPLKLIQNKESQFANEVVLRKQQWEETVKTDPEWILALDADEIFEERFKDEVQSMLAKAQVDAFYFRLYDFWDATHFRDDFYWKAHHYYHPFLIRYRPEEEYRWKETAQHCGRFPHTVALFSRKNSNLRLKHFGWVKLEDRIAKYQRYQKLDPDARFGWKEQYESILDESPNLACWDE